MANLKTIVCTFCKGTGRHPHFTGTCPVCKGRGENQIRGKFMSCPDCSGTGQKRGTTLTCWTCSGLGVVPDTREEVRKAKEEMERVQQEMEEERRELREITQPPAPQKLKERKFKRIHPEGFILKEKTKVNTDANTNESEVLTGKIFCQCCAKKVARDSAVKVCLDCFRKIKKL